MKWLAKIIVASSLVFNRYFQPKDTVSVAEIEEQLEPEELRDEWQTMMHHDDVTPEERALLESDNPEDILKAQETIFQRQAEFQEWWDDRETRNAAFYGPYHKQIQSGVKATDIHSHEGWEDDEDLPEYYETVIRIDGSDAGKVVKVPFDMEERLVEMLGNEVAVDEQYRAMHTFLAEVYTERGVLNESDYVLAQAQWETKAKIPRGKLNAN